MKHQQLAAPLRRFLPAHWLGLLFGLLLLSLLTLPVHAADASDPPDRVGRVSEVNGQAWIYATDSNEWIPAVRNRPVTTGDRISTEADGRAEVRIGSSVLRIAPNSELEVLRLDDDNLNLQLHSGSVTARLRTREAADEFSLATGEGLFRTDRTGNYRFDRVDENSNATALSGQITYEGDGTALTVQQGQRVEFWKEGGVPQYSITSPARDEFASWVASRDAREERSVSTRYVSPEMTGVEDLDRYGRWEQNVDYGPLWIPRNVAPGWAPYRMGHWAWVSPWGWTWVDDAPWGFAPFHYGRWVWYRSNWCWTPGRYVARPVYAPALVAWVGGPNVNVSVTVGRAPTVGWFPLAPREIYVPGFRVSPRYVRNVNVTQVTNIINVTTIINNPTTYMANTRYVNRGLPHAVTVVPSAVVERRQPVAPATRAVNDRVLRDMVRERPRADAPVVAPPRVAQGSREVVDPRITRPGFGARPAPQGAVQGVAPGAPGRQFGNGTPPAAVAPAQRPQEPREREPRVRDNPVVNAPTTPANPAPAANASPPVSPTPGLSRGNDSRGSRPPGVSEAPPRGQPLPRATVPERPDRALAPPNDERRRNPEMPGPPRADTATQAPAPRPQMQAPQQPAPVLRPPVTPPQVIQRSQPTPREDAPVVRQPVAPPPPLVQRPQPAPREAAPVVRQPVAPPPPVVVQRPQPAPREAAPMVRQPVAPPPPVVVHRPQPAQPQQPEVRQRGREEQGNERGERGERGERR
jgi:hypothetical protein